MSHRGWNIVTSVLDMISSGTHESDVQTMLMKTAHGKAFTRAMHSAAAQRPGKMTKAGVPTTTMQRLANSPVAQTDTAKAITGAIGTMISAQKKVSRTGK